ncbi:hypothetical protein Vadar_010568 [Vaccinium darrowii]|uniref:Uncharacterized protein n=1 Tax=Vaccinium darrowii TaxID=229202 RepID=A0ACB7XYS4_9ERIC|nr:hypothetical protein Vadar_010568 [Vaccinium darrowii]
MRKVQGFRQTWRIAKFTVVFILLYDEIHRTIAPCECESPENRTEKYESICVDSFPGSEVYTALQILCIEHEHLKKKYNEESCERRRVYNEVIELKGNIRENELQIICSNSSKGQLKFDHVFRPEDTQEAVFLQTSPMVCLVLERYYVCIFAYWTGKTFTMGGTSENRE